MASEDNPHVRVPPPLIFGGLLALGLVIDSGPFRPAPAQLAGAGLGIAGLALIAVALGLFAGSKTRPEPWQPASRLVDRGLYRFTRNPMYLGMALLSLGVALAFSSLPGILLSLVALVIIDRTVVTREEAYLERRFGPDYIAYTKRVRRWL